MPLYSITLSDQRIQQAGYTPLHLAVLYGNEE